MKEITLNNNNATLIPYDDRYFEQIFEWFSENQIRDLYFDAPINLNKMNFYEAFNKRIDDIYHTFLLIIDVNSNRLVGLIYSYNYEQESEIIYFNIFLQEKDYNKNLEENSIRLFCNYLFTYYPIRKIYFNLFDYEKEKIKSIKKTGFTMVGKLNEHTFNNGKYRDVFFFELNREGFYKIDYEN